MKSDSSQRRTEDPQRTVAYFNKPCAGLNTQIHFASSMCIMVNWSSCQSKSSNLNSVIFGLHIAVLVAEQNCISSSAENIESHFPRLQKLRLIAYVYQEQLLKVYPTTSNDEQSLLSLLCIQIALSKDSTMFVQRSEEQRNTSTDQSAECKSTAIVS